jgi:hypothetical protein
MKQMSKFTIGYFFPDPDLPDDFFYQCGIAMFQDLEKEVNSSGGIGGLQLRIERLSDFDLNTLSFSDYDCILGFDRSLSREFLDPDNDYLELSDNTLIFADIPEDIRDDEHLLGRSNLFNVNSIGVSDAHKLGFVASAIGATNVILIETPEFANQETYDSYQKCLHDWWGWKGNFQPFDRSQEEIGCWSTEIDEDSPSESDLQIQKIRDTVWERLESKIAECSSSGVLLIGHNLEADWLDLVDGIIDFIITDPKHAENPPDIVSLDLSETPGWRHGIVKVMPTKVTDVDYYAYLDKYVSRFPTLNVDFINLFARELAPIPLMQYAARNLEKNLTAGEMRSLLPAEINRIDGYSDVFISHGVTYRFQNHQLLNDPPTIFKSVRTSANARGLADILFDYQFSTDAMWLPETTPLEVIYCYIDLHRVSEVNISESFWIGEMDLEINSPIRDPIEHIRFLNKALTKNDMWTVSKLRERQTGQRFEIKYRLVGAFQLEAEISDFPFDQQQLRVDDSLERSAQNCILQIPEATLVDKTFVIDGWVLSNASCGTNFVKEFDRSGTNLDTSVHVRTNNRVEWSVTRNEKVSLLRSLIPLLVMMVLAWYSSFNGSEAIFETIEINTTVFLAGVALYFSAEKPKGASFTFIDKMFIYFYLAIGLLILSEFTLMIGERLYEITHLVWQVGIPFGIAIFLQIVWRKVKHIRKIERESNG